MNTSNRSLRQHATPSLSTTFQHDSARIEQDAYGTIAQSAESPGSELAQSELTPDNQQPAEDARKTIRTIGEELNICQEKTDRMNAIEEALSSEITDQWIQLQHAAAKIVKAKGLLHIVSHRLEEAMVLLTQSNDALELIYDVPEHLGVQMCKEPESIQRLCKLLTTAIMVVKNQANAE